MTAFTARIGDCQRKFSCTMSGTLAVLQVSTMAFASVSVERKWFLTNHRNSKRCRKFDERAMAMHRRCDIDEIEPLRLEHLFGVRISSCDAELVTRELEPLGFMSQMAAIDAPFDIAPGIELIDGEKTAANERAPEAPPCSAQLRHLHQRHALLQPALGLVDHHGDDDDKALDHHLPE